MFVIWEGIGKERNDIYLDSDDISWYHHSGIPNSPRTVQEEDRYHKDKDERVYDLKFTIMY